jgi:hypothetical protein
MITLLLHLLRLSSLSSAVATASSPHQLAAYKRTVTRPKLRTTDQLFWAGLARVWATGSSPLARQGCAHGRPIERPELGKVIPIREVGGLHHRYAA